MIRGAHHHFDPAVLGQETGLGVYNAGVDGQSLLFFYALEQLIVTEYSPKLILLHLGPGDLKRQASGIGPAFGAPTACASSGNPGA